MRVRTLPVGLAGCVVLATGAAPAAADSVELRPVRDATLYFDATGSQANGAGQRLFAGVTAQGGVRRALLAFDLSSIPAGSTITAASLRLNMSRSIQAGDAAFTLHRVSRSWGEGASVAVDPEGIPVDAQAGDATWLHAFFQPGGGGTMWTNPGGDFAAAASASLTVGQSEGFYTFTSPTLLADVQAWLNAPAANHGWMLRGDETSQPTAKRFDSRQHEVESARPLLAVEYIVPAPGAAAALCGLLFVRSRRR